MLQETNIALFLVASLALIATPGPVMIYVNTRGVAQRRRAALFSALGVCSGLAFHTSFATIGLSALLAQSAVAFSLVKYAGAAYLVYLGIKTVLSKKSIALTGGPQRRWGSGASSCRAWYRTSSTPRWRSSSWLSCRSS